MESPLSLLIQGQVGPKIQIQNAPPDACQVYCDSLCRAIDQKGSSAITLPMQARELAGQFALANPGLAMQHHHTFMRRIAQRARYLLYEIVAADERPVAA